MQHCNSMWCSFKVGFSPQQWCSKVGFFHSAAKRLASLHSSAAKIGFSPQQCSFKVGRTVAGSWLRSRLCQFLLLCAPHSHDNHPLRSKYRLIEIFVREISPPVSPLLYPHFHLNHNRWSICKFSIESNFSACSLHSKLLCRQSIFIEAHTLLSGSSKQFP